MKNYIITRFHSDNVSVNLLSDKNRNKIFKILQLDLIFSTTKNRYF
jgi:hypothetical protein